MNKTLKKDNKKSQKTSKESTEVVYTITKKQLIIIGSIFAACILVAGIFILLLFDKKEPEPEIKTCLVQFNTNGGLEIEANSLKCGGTIKVPEIPEKNGFTFLGWYLNDKEYDFNSPINNNIVLEAKWEAQEDTKIVIVSFDTAGGSKQASIEVEKGSYLTKPVDPTKKGYTFLGWYLDNKKFKFESNIIEEEIVLTAKWRKIENNQNDSSTQDNSSVSNEETKDKNQDCKFSIVNNKMENYVFSIGEATETNSLWGFEKTSSSCSIEYKTNNKDIITINSDGIATGKTIGKTSISVCISNKNSSKELKCITNSVEVKYKKGSKKALEDSKKTVDKLINNYWYYDDKTHAHLEPKYTNNNLIWNSHCIDLQKNKFIITADTHVTYENSTSIHEAFDVKNAYENAYQLIEKYNIRINNDKLYITIGNKTYTFTRWEFEKPINPKLYIEIDNKEIEPESTFEFTAKLVPYKIGLHDNPDDYEYNVVSYNNKVVTDCKIYSRKLGVMNIKCKALKAGTAKINVGMYTAMPYAESSINVTIGKLVKSISLNETSINLKDDERETLIATINPSNASNKNVKWESSNNKVATVDSEGNVTAQGPGTATITATSEEGGHTAHCVVNVSAIKVSSISLNKTSLSLIKGNSAILTATISPSNASNKNITWSSSDTNVAIVKDGKVTAKGKGTATIVAKTEDGNYIAQCTVSVSNPALKATVSVGVQTSVSSSGVARHTVATLNASGGTGTYKYYSLKVYKDGEYIGTNEDTTKNTLYLTGNPNGVYTIEYEVRDSEGTIVTGTSTSTISGF